MLYEIGAFLLYNIVCIRRYELSRRVKKKPVERSNYHGIDGNQNGKNHQMKRRISWHNKPDIKEAL